MKKALKKRWGLGDIEFEFLWLSHIVKLSLNCANPSKLVRSVIKDSHTSKQGHYEDVTDSVLDLDTIESAPPSAESKHVLPEKECCF